MDGMIHLTDRSYGLSFESDNIPWGEFDQCATITTAGPVGAGTVLGALIQMTQTGLFHIHGEVSCFNVPAAIAVALQIQRTGSAGASQEQVCICQVSDNANADRVDILCRINGATTQGGGFRFFLLDAIGAGAIVRVVWRFKYLGRL